MNEMSLSKIIKDISCKAVEHPYVDQSERLYKHTRLLWLTNIIF